MTKLDNDLLDIYVKLFEAGKELSEQYERYDGDKDWTDWLRETLPKTGLHEAILQPFIRSRERTARVSERFRIKKAWRPLKVALIASADMLDKPYVDAPDMSPWTSIKERMKRIEAELQKEEV